MAVDVTVGAGATHVSSWDEAWLVYDLWRGQDPEREIWKTRATFNKLGVSPTGEEGSYLVIAVVDGVEPSGGIISAAADGYDDGVFFGNNDPAAAPKGGGLLIILALALLAFLSFR